MKRLLQILSYILVAAIASCVTLLLTVEAPIISKPSSKLDAIQSLINQVYIGDADKKAMEDAASAAMVSAIGDRWSHYMTVEEYQAYKERMDNAYVGVGITITKQDGSYIEINKVEVGGPAEEAGIKAGDMIIAVQGQDVAPMTIDEVKNLVRGEENTQVNLTLRRDHREFTVAVTRRTINTVVASGQMLDGNIGLITITNFDSRCAEETIAAIESLVEQGAKGLIFDVRYNPGGYKHELVALLDYLLPEGALFRSVDYEGNESVDESDADYLDMPMAVLMNGDSYSAAEFFAAALSEYGVAKMVGEPTTGKGRFQQTFNLQDGSAVVISVGKYCTPNGVDLTDVGLTPDVLVDIDDELYMNIYYGRVDVKDDPQIQAALKLLLNP